ncbi:MAG: ATP-grasp domain-containing protein [Gemmatimonadaceae bacterium]
MTERATLCLSAARDKLDAAHALYVFPPHDVLQRAMDKGETTKLAQSLGIAVPNTWLARDRSDADRISAQARFPVVLKAASSEEVSAEGVTRSTGAPVYADASSFLDAFELMRRRASAVVIQEFIRGEGKGYFALMSHGELRAEFAHRRLRDVRPSGSGSALRESIAIDPELRAAGLGILQALRWHGVAMVEFRDPGDGRPVFLEINGRFWGSLALAVHAGTDFPALLADMAIGKSCAASAPHRPGVRCRWLVGDLQHLVAVFKGPPAGYPDQFPSRIGTVARLLRPVRGTFHDNFTLDDPLPEVGDWIHFLARRIPRELRKRRSRNAGSIADASKPASAPREEVR